MFCRKCGVEQAEGTRFCPACAYPVGQVVIAQGASVEKTALKAIWIVVGIFGFIMLLGIVAAIVIPKLVDRQPPAGVTRLG